MGERKEQLSLLFGADTDILLQSCLDGYKKYAKWFEKLPVKQINCDLEEENNFLRRITDKAMDILEGGVLDRYV